MAKIKDFQEFMPLVTLTSDWNKNDYYIGSLKGRILSVLPSAQIIDINHEIAPFRLAQAAFVVRNSYSHFPEGTIHLLCVNSEPAKDKKFLLVQYDGHYFISADNGIFGLICHDEDKISGVYAFSKNPGHMPFSLLDAFPQMVQAIDVGKVESAMSKVKSFEKQVPMRPVFEDHVISGSVIYIDTYQNIITNITKNLFNEVGKGRKFEILVQSNYYRITRLNTTYNETSMGELLALFNSINLLEVAIKDGNAAELLNVNLNSVVRVKFFD